MQVKANPEGKIGTCGCGRSPTGDCIGWHGLDEQAYNHARSQWIEEQFRKDQEDEDDAARLSRDTDGEQRPWPDRTGFRAGDGACFHPAPGSRA